MRNRSVPTDAVLPHVTYQNVGQALAWLSETFGFREHYRYGNPAEPAGAQVSFGNSWLMLESAREGRSTPSQTGSRTQYLTLFVDDVDAIYAQVKAKGAKIVEEINEPIYGERQFGVEDLDGHVWLFSQHIRDADPAEWGALKANPM